MQDAGNNDRLDEKVLLPPAARPERPEPQLPLPLPSRSSARAQGEPTGCSRWTAAGCLGVIGIMLLAIISGVLSIDTSLVPVVNRARNRIWSSLPFEIDRAERTRTRRNLEQLLDAIAEAPDPTFAAGRFLGVAGAALEDRQLTVAEVDQLNQCMEEIITGQVGDTGEQP